MSDEGTSWQVVLVDGDCALCSAYAQFVSTRDARQNVYFETQQSDAGKLLLQHVGQAQDLSTIVMIESVDGGPVRGYTRSTAVLRTLRLLQAPWWVLYWVGMVFPRAFRDLIYMQVARWRYRLFGRTAACQLPDKVLRQRMQRRPPAFVVGVVQASPAAKHR